MMIQIKQSLFAITTALVMGSSIHSACAIYPILPQKTTTYYKMGYDWTVVQEFDGISIAFSCVSIGDERFLSVKFENTTAESTDFIWSMTKNNTPIRITEDEMIESRIHLDSSASEIVDGMYLIEMIDGDQFSDFFVTIQPTKR